MNLTRALDVALPEIPARTFAESTPRLDPGTTFKEHIEDGQPMVRIYVPCAGGMFTFPAAHWKLAQLFDGKRSYQELAELYSQQTGIPYDAEQVREFAADLEVGDFWYKTPQEKNILLLKQSQEERRKKLKVRSKWADLSQVIFPAFNPDRFLTWAYAHTKFVYTPWFTILTVMGFAIGAGITVAHWSEIGRDTLQFYNFAKKTWGDVLILYVLTIFVTAIHEFAHAHSCKHYGGRVPAMGFALVYLMPAFYTDTTEGFVHGSPYQRLIIAMSGIWSELIVCSIATPIWWGTPPDTLVHNGAYFIMMITGLMSLFVNWNPLMKLDGYFMLCEIVGVRDLKEDSTAYVSAWLRRHIWGLPVEVPYVPKRRRPGFVVYALLSGAYSYTVLYVVARFAGNFVRNFSPEWGFIPEIGVALLIFRSRIRLLVNFMKFVYLDKKDRIRAWFTPRRATAIAAAAIIVTLLPIKHESVSGKFLLEPTKKAEVRAHVPGTITRLDVEEGRHVSAGQTLAELRNLSVQSDYEDAQARLVMASDRANAAAMKYSDYGTALHDRERLTEQVRQFSQMNAALQIVSPISGIVVTPRVEDQMGAYLTPGQEFLEVADLSVMRARIYVSEYDLYRVVPHAHARVQVDGFAKKWDAQVESIAIRPTEMDPQLGGTVALKGINPPHFYLVSLLVPNPEENLKPGMTGFGRVYGLRRSLAGLAWESVANFWGRKIW